MELFLERLIGFGVVEFVVHKKLLCLVGLTSQFIKEESCRMSPYLSNAGLLKARMISPSFSLKAKSLLAEYGTGTPMSHSFSLDAVGVSLF